jgi:hypothetical protein
LKDLACANKLQDNIEAVVKCAEFELSAPAKRSYILREQQAAIFDKYMVERNHQLFSSIVRIAAL